MPLLQPYRYPDRLEIGVDEAGYGAFYGRVYAAAVVWPHDYNHPLIRDSKKLTPAQREIAYDLVVENAIAYGIAYREATAIDTVNIREADIQALHSAIDHCRVIPDIILVDGISFHPYLCRPPSREKGSEGLYIDHDLVVKGDGLYCSIAAASILAKVSRDRWIASQVQAHPELRQYGMPHNQGYGSPEHIAAIRFYGLTPGHRHKGYGSKFFACPYRWLGNLDDSPGRIFVSIGDDRNNSSGKELNVAYGKKNSPL